MSELAVQMRSVYYRVLVVLLFPFVFVATHVEQVAPGWLGGFALGFKFSLVLSAFVSVVLLASAGFFTAT